MASDVQLDEPAQNLYDSAVAHTPRWLGRVTIEAAARGGIEVTSEAFVHEVSAMVDRVAPTVLNELYVLLVTDVDEQRTNPLSVFRTAVAEPNDLLQRVGARPRADDRFAAERFPDDVFQLGPAAWSDIDPAMHEPGITWGAWKAMTVLRRRRDDGLR